MLELRWPKSNPTIGDFSGNTRKIREFYERAAEQGAELVIFPELAICGYMPGDFLEKDSFLQRCESVLLEVAALTAGEGKPAVLVGTPLKCARSVAGKRARNVAALLEGGEVKFLQQKALLPFYDVVCSTSSGTLSRRASQTRADRW